MLVSEIKTLSELNSNDELSSQLEDSSDDILLVSDAINRWYEMCKRPKSLYRLTQFYVNYKYILMSYDPKVQKEIGSLIGKDDHKDMNRLYSSFFSLFIRSLGKTATVNKNTNVLEHIMGYFKRNLSSEEKGDLRVLISQYHNQRIALHKPVELLKQYAVKYDSKYLKMQFYLSSEIENCKRR